MARTDNLSNFLTDVANAIKTRKGDGTPIKASDFDTEILNLPNKTHTHHYVQQGDKQHTEDANNEYCTYILMQCECGDSYREYIDKHDWYDMGIVDGEQGYICMECYESKYVPIK